MIRLLLDECLSPTLVARAQARGVDATHVRFLGRAGYQDYNLIDIIVAGEYCFVTNNARDFLKLLAEVDWHDGLVIILPQTRLAEQIVLFEAALDFVGGLDHTINRVVEVHSATDIRLSNLPPDESR